MMFLVGSLLALLAAGMAVLSHLLGWKLRINFSWMTHGWIITTTTLVALALLATDPSVFPDRIQLSGISFASNVMSIGVMFTAIALQGRPKATVLAFALVASFFLVITGFHREGIDVWEGTTAQWLFVWAVAATLLSGFTGVKPFLLVLGFPVALSRQVTKKRTVIEDPHMSFRGVPTREHPEIRIKDPKAYSTVFVRSDHIQVSRLGRTYELFPFTDALHLQIHKEFKEAKTENGRSKDPGSPL